jgi:xylose dehydrogenase (NAD/NADP)
MQTEARTEQKPVRWGVISTADIGVKAVAPAIMASSNSSLIAVGSRDSKRAVALYDFVPDIRVYGDYESVIDDPDVEAIYIPLPNSLHAEWVIRALEGGKHVLCEKPLATTAAEARTMVETAHSHHRLLMEAFMYRFHPQIVWSLGQVRAGTIGPVRLVRSSFSFDIRSRPGDIRLKPELAGGSLMDIGCYCVNLCRAVYGQIPQAVASRVYVERPAGVDMAVNAVLDYGEGRFGLIDASFELPTRQIAEIVGEAGVITIPVPFLPGNMEAVVFLTRNGQMSEQKFERVDQYRLEVEHFAECIRTGREPLRLLSETIENMATIEAIYQSAGHDWPIV